MRRYGIIYILPMVFVLTGAWRAGAAVSIVGTKHDLSYRMTGTYVAASGDPAQGGTSEVCVFCHTPHGGNADAPLWNRSASAASYQTYTSDVLAGLGYAAAEDPNSGPNAAIHVKTRICLTCHDGTVALGRLVNMPTGFNTGYTDVQMKGGASTLPSSASGFIGVDLSDDHPVAIPYDNTRDQELLPGPIGKVRLYNISGGAVVATNPPANGDFVECTSCHDVHNNTNGAFLIDSNRNSRICTSCHNKSGYTGTSIHASSATPYSASSGTLGSTVGGLDGVLCMDCHFPHKAGGTGTPPLMTPQASPNTYGAYLLSFQKDASCFNNPNRWNESVFVCHGTGSSNGFGLNIDIETEMAKNYSHAYNASYGTVHGAAEVKAGTPAGWAAGKKHVECSDCHNSHTAGNVLHSQGTNTIGTSSPLYGASGVVVQAWPATWSPVSTLNYAPFEGWGTISASSQLPVSGSYYEYQICIKCHSNFGWNTTPWSSSHGYTMTDQAREFNPSVSTFAFHPVAGQNSNNQGTMTAGSGWTTGSQTMYCSDCHTNDSGIVGFPQGPHGSGAAYLLAASFDDTSAYNSQGSYQSAGDLCFACHDPNTYLSGAGTGTGFLTTANVNLHTQHYADSTNAVSRYGYKCVNCHVRVPHGWDRKAMVIVRGDGAMHGSTLYELAGGATITGLVGGTLPLSGTYANGVLNKDINCLTAIGCHQ